MPGQRYWKAPLELSLFCQVCGSDFSEHWSGQREEVPCAHRFLPTSLSHTLSLSRSLYICIYIYHARTHIRAETKTGAEGLIEGGEGSRDADRDENYKGRNGILKGRNLKTRSCCMRSEKNLLFGVRSKQRELSSLVR